MTTKTKKRGEKLAGYLGTATDHFDLRDDVLEHVKLVAGDQDLALRMAYDAGARHALRARQRNPSTGRARGPLPFGAWADEVPTIVALQELAVTGVSHQKMADTLNEGGYTTRDGSEWTRYSVATKLRELAALTG